MPPKTTKNKQNKKIYAIQNARKEDCGEYIIDIVTNFGVHLFCTNIYNFFQFCAADVTSFRKGGWGLVGGIFFYFNNQMYLMMNLTECFET